MASALSFGGAGAPAGHAPAACGIVPLTEFISANDCHSLNTRGDLKLMLASGLPLHSDVDAQMILTVAFRELVTITSLSLASEEGLQPTSLRIYTNRTTFGFDDMEDAPVQELLLKPGDVDGKKMHKLKPGKFSGISSLTIAVDRADADASCIKGLTFYGQNSASADVSKIQKWYVAAIYGWDDNLPATNTRHPRYCAVVDSKEVPFEYDSWIYDTARYTRARCNSRICVLATVYQADTHNNFDSNWRGARCLKCACIFFTSQLVL
jgi:hypothetical protein